MRYDPSGGGSPNTGMTPMQSALLAARQRMALRTPAESGYMTGTQHQNVLAQMMRKRGDSPQDIQQGIHDSANSYAQNRLGQFSKIADLFGGNFADAYHHQDMSDPAAAYRALSGIFSKQSQGQGIADPRVMLAQLLFQAKMGGQGGGA